MYLIFVVSFLSLIELQIAAVSLIQQGEKHKYVFKYCIS